MRKKPMKSITIYLTDEQYKDVEDASDLLDISVVEFVKTATYQKLIDTESELKEARE